MKLIARYDGVEVELQVERNGREYRVLFGDRWVGADLAECGPYVRSLRLDDGTQYGLVHHREGSTYEIALAGASFQIEMLDPLSARRKGREDESSAGGIVKAPMPGRVVRLIVAPRQSVRKGSSLLILEAMKMENEIQSPIDGVVDRIFVSPGDTVEGGAELVHVAPLD